MTVYRFALDETTWDGPDQDAKKVLGGKGAALALMTKAGLNVPPGFTIPCETWAKYRAAEEKDAFIDSLMLEVTPHLKWLETKFGYAPLLSVRSGAPVSPHYSASERARREGAVCT